MGRAKAATRLNRQTKPPIGRPSHGTSNNLSAAHSRNSQYQLK